MYRSYEFQFLIKVRGLKTYSTQKNKQLKIKIIQIQHKLLNSLENHKVKATRTPSKYK